jgi:hypothetical protein
VIAISKAPSHDRGHQCCDTLAGILQRKHLACGKTAPDTNSKPKKLSQAATAGAMSEQRKSPALPGFSDDRLFRSVHFASLAI